MQSSAINAIDQRVLLSEICSMVRLSHRIRPPRKFPQRMGMRMTTHQTATDTLPERNRLWRRLLPRPSNQPGIQIISPLTVGECHRVLTGKDNSGWFGNEFLKLLQLHGRMSTKDISVRLRAGCVSGRVEQHLAGARITVIANEKEGTDRPIIGETALATLVAIPFVFYSFRAGQGFPAYLIFPAMYLARRRYTESRISWPEYPGNVDELAEMLAQHLQGGVHQANLEGTTGAVHDFIQVAR